MVDLQELHETLTDKGLVVLGFNFADDAGIAKKLLRDNQVTFPTILDASESANHVSAMYRVSGVPLTYLIDREGKIVDAWYGYRQGDDRGKKALQKFGIQ